MTSILLSRWETEHVYLLLQESDARVSLYHSFAASTVSVMSRELKRTSAINHQIRSNVSFLSSAMETSIHRLVAENGFFRSELASRSSLDAVLAEPSPVPAIQEQQKKESRETLIESMNYMCRDLAAQRCARSPSTNNKIDSYERYNTQAKSVTSSEAALNTNDGASLRNLSNEVDFLMSANERLHEENRQLKAERESVMDTKSLVVKQLLEVQGYRAAQELGTAVRERRTPVRR
eukprot:Tbor_TRINITY_DN5023_c0_g3::TRINITY_DN5023_c0_g3_i1::g.14067::m.14067